MVSVKSVGAMAILFGVIVCAGVFMDWINVNTIFYHILDYGKTFTGWDIFNNNGNMTFGGNNYPLATLAAGAITVLLGLVYAASKGKNAVVGIFLVLLGIAAIALPAYFYYSELSSLVADNYYTWSELINTYVPVKMGLIISMIGGLMTMISGFMGLAAKE